MLSNISFWAVNLSYITVGNGVITDLGPEIKYFNVDAEIEKTSTEVTTFGSDRTVLMNNTNLIIRTSHGASQLFGVRDMMIHGNLVYGQGIYDAMMFLFEIEALDGTTGATLASQLYI